MNPALIFLPSVALVLICYAVLITLFRSRVAGMRKHRVGIQTLADPEREAEVFSEAVNPADNFENLFEMPVLFFVASIVIFVLGKVDGLYLAGAWLYVVFRALHSYVHCGSNRVKYRFRFFGLSVLVLLGLWLRIGWQIIATGGE